MNNRDFETLAGSIPFPAGDIGADYSPVEKERVEGPLTRVLAVLVGKGPLGGKVAATDNSGKLYTSKSAYTRQLLVPSRTTNATETVGPIQVPSFGWGYIGFVVTAITIGAGTWSGALRDVNVNGDEYAVFVTDTNTTPIGQLMPVSDESSVPFITSTIKLKMILAGGATACTWYAELYYR